MKLAYFLIDINKIRMQVLKLIVKVLNIFGHGLVFWLNKK